MFPLTYGYPFASLYMQKKNQIFVNPPVIEKVVCMKHLSREDAHFR